MNEFLKSIYIVGIILLSINLSHAQTASPRLFSQLDEVVPDALQSFHTPGMSVGIIRDNQVLFLKGYGQRHLAPAQAVNQDTYFRLGSTSKAFTAAALAIAIDEFDLDWQTRVIDVLPDFAMQDPWVTREFRLVDLLAHRSGAGRWRWRQYAVARAQRL